MKFEPQNFFIGLIDFFSILMPGSLLSYFIKYQFFDRATLQLITAESWMVFLFSSYLLGHFIFLIGAGILDEYVYDKIINATYARQVKDLSEGKELKNRFTRWLARKFFNNYTDLSLKSALSIKEFYLNPLMAEKSVNAFQWCKARLDTEASQALATVQRFEANSKFFRSLFVVLFILIPWNLIIQYSFLSKLDLVLMAISGLALLLLALWRYIDQREKSTQQAYWNIIALEANRKDGFRQTAVPRIDGMTHAGGVVFRKVNSPGEPRQFLLTRPKADEDQWVLPKGHIEPGELIEEAAVREVREETGMWARIKDPCHFTEVEFEAKTGCERKSEIVKVRYYLMEFLEEMKSKKRRKKMGIEDRKTEWMSFDDVKKKLEKIPVEVKGAIESINSKLNSKETRNRY